jgi:uncharacterized membrane protein
MVDDRNMTRIRETVNIDAPASKVWAVVHEDVKNAPKWSPQLSKVDKLDREPPGTGTRYRYHLDLPAGIKETLEVEQTEYVKPKRCTGRFTGGPLKGTWSYTYTEHRDKTTRLVYEMDYELSGFLRLMGGMLARQYAEGIRDNMEGLKEYVEAGKGPK